MQLNKSKCSVMSLVSKNKAKLDFTYAFNSDSIYHLCRVSCTKDLGITIDSELTFSEHIAAKINTARKMLGIIYRNFKNISKSCFLLLYKSFVRCHLEYGASLFFMESLSARADR